MPEDVKTESGQQTPLLKVTNLEGKQLFKAIVDSYQTELECAVGDYLKFTSFYTLQEQAIIVPIFAENLSRGADETSVAQSAVKSAAKSPVKEASTPGKLRKGADNQPAVKKDEVKKKD